MTAIAITKGIQLTVTRTPGLTRVSKYPWEQMLEVGDGFPVPEGINLKGFRTLAQKAGAARGKMFSVGKNMAEGGKYYCVLKGFREVDAAAAAAEVAEAAAEAAEQEDDADETGEQVAEEASY